MARGLNRLTDREVKAFKGPGRIADGGGLYWNGATFAFIYTNAGRRREAGLGSVTLAQARAKASEMRDVLASGSDPIAAKRLDRVRGATFAEIAAEAVETLKPRWRHVEREVSKWDRAIAACKTISSTPAKDVSVEDIRSVLKPLDTRPAQKRFVLSVIRRVLDVAVAKELRPGNPAVARIIGKVTPIAHSTNHNPSLSYRDVPAFVSGLRAKDTPAARCLEFIILTGVRKTEATEMTWAEVDLAEGIWHIPAHRMKAGRAHDVPLTERALILLLEQQLRHPQSKYVFPGNAGRKHLSASAFLHLTPDGVTVHGFRSSLREFLGDETDVSYETAEETIAHRVGDQTTTAYRRASGLAKRRAALTYWHDFICQKNINKKKKPQRLQLVEEATI